MSEKLILELLRDLKSGQDRIETELRDLNIRLAILETKVKVEEPLKRDVAECNGGPVAVKPAASRRRS